MKRTPLLTWLLLVTLVLGCVFAIPQLRERVRIESGQKQVELVMSWQDIQTLADKSGEPTDHWLNGLRDAGLFRVLLTEADGEQPETLASLTAVGLEVGQIGGTPASGPQGLRYLNGGLNDPKTEMPAELRGDADPSTDDLLPALEERDAVLILLENKEQTGVILRGELDRGQEGDLVLTTQWNGSCVKCAWLTDELCARYQTLGYDGPQEIVNVAFRAIVDRGMTAFWMRPFQSDDGMVTDLSVYQDAFTQLAQRLAPAGYAYGEASGIPPLTLGTLSLAMLGIGVFALAVFVFGMIFSLKKTWIPAVLLLLGILESVGGAWAAPELQRTCLALLAALVFPFAAVLLLGDRLDPSKTQQARIPAGSYLLTALMTCAVSAAGGLYIGAILGTSDYMLILRIFRGVKLSQMAVYLFALLWLAWRLLHVPGNSLRADSRALIRENRNHWKLKLLVLILFLAVVCGVYLLRTGDGMLAASQWELRARNWLETVLLYRPRTKEFLVAWPALALACVCAARGNRLLTWLFGVLASIGFASVVNTFCHIRSHLTVALARTGLGLVLGTVLGLIILLLVCALWRAGARETQK